MNDFKKWDDTYGTDKGSAPERKKEYRQVPDGIYECELERLELVENSKGRPMIKVMFRIFNGEYARYCIFENRTLASDTPEKTQACKHIAMEFLKKLDLLEPEDVDYDGTFSDLNDLLGDILDAGRGCLLKIRRYTKDGWTHLQPLGVVE